MSARLIKSFPEADFRVFTIRPPVAGAVDVYEGLGIPRSHGARGNLRAWYRLFSYARRNRKDVFHLLNAGPWYLLAVRLAGVSGIVYSIRGTRYWSGFLQELIRKAAWKLALNSKVRLVSNSEYSRQVFLEKINPGAEIRVLYNPVSTSRFVPPAERRGSGMMKIIYAGRLNEGKNLEGWIDVAFAVHSRMPETVFGIYGSGPLEERLRERISKPGTEGYISLKGFRADIENVYREADLFLFLSEYESFGNVVVESILCGTPVLAADIPSMREIFRDYPEFLLNPGSDVADQVCRKLADYDRLLSLAGRAGAEFRKRFSPEEHIETLDGIYRSFD